MAAADQAAPDSAPDDRAARDAAAAERAAVARLRSPATIRERCARLLTLGEEDRLPHFRLAPERLEAVAERVEAVTRAAYPDLAVPYHSRWRHFAVGSPAATARRLAALEERLAPLDRAERARARIDLAVTSVLLDAGAGMPWRYREPGSGEVHARSEGLALASLHMFLAGAFSSDPTRPLQTDAKGLRALTPGQLAEAFQVSGENPLVGLEGRLGLLVRLGDALEAAPALFAPGAGSGPPRPGGLYDALSDAGAEGAEGADRADSTDRTDATPLAAADVLAAVLEGFGPIWPGRVSLGGVNLGDVWPHPALATDAAEAAAAGREAAPGADLVPFHKLSQWLTYSLLEPFEEAGRAIAGLGALTGLPEYRNGGLLLDLGLLVLRDPEAARGEHLPGDPLVVEWRALTVALLDRVAARVRARLGRSEEEFPLAKVLQGGTWTAGREAARERRADGGPPLRIRSDGTVF